MNTLIEKEIRIVLQNLKAVARVSESQTIKPTPKSAMYDNVWYIVPIHLTLKPQSV